MLRLLHPRLAGVEAEPSGLPDFFKSAKQCSDQNETGVGLCKKQGSQQVGGR